MHFVFGVIAASMWFSFKQNVSGWISTNTGFNFKRQITSAVAAKVKGVVMISSPGLRSHAIRATWRASVPLAQAMTWAPSRYSDKLFSNFLTGLPPMNCVESKICWMASSISTFYLLYCALRSFIGIFISKFYWFLLWNNLTRSKSNLLYVLNLLKFREANYIVVNNNLNINKIL